MTEETQEEEIMVRYPKMPNHYHRNANELLDMEDDFVVLQEKLDGSNFRFIIKDGMPIFGSRDKILDRTKAGNFKKACDYVWGQLNSFSDLKKWEGWTFFGEAMIKHGLYYNLVHEPFYGFDVRTPKGNWILPHDIPGIFRALDLLAAPFVAQMLIKDLRFDDRVDIPRSKFASVRAEGVVIRSTTRPGLRCKFKPQPKQGEKITVIKEVVKDDNDKWFRKYATQMRIEKQIYKMNDDGHDFEMAMMKFLPERVYQDIWDEEVHEIAHSSWILNIPTLRKMFSKRCSQVLATFLSELR